jgi:ubiquinone/menaquinone biosynthesis C-methylase UbiE
MKRIITADDFKDIIIKGAQRGLPFVLSKLQYSGLRRTKTAFDKTRINGSHWWHIPYVNERWNTLISGDKNKSNIDFIAQDVLKNRKEIHLVSIGSGTCNTEIELAQKKNFKKITCIDLSKDSLEKATFKIDELKLKNIEVICTDIYNYSFKEKVDVVLFKASLHHFKNIEKLMSEKIKPIMKDDGLVVIDEYVGPNRLQYPKKQIQAINEVVQTIPRKYRKIFKTSLYKNYVSGSGIIRMILADPSECVDSSNILPSLHKWFDPIIEKPYGGNLLMYALKDIAHHFYNLDKEKKMILDEIFKIEDDYVLEYKSDFVFGVYQLK